MKIALFISGGLGYSVLEHLFVLKKTIICVFTDSKSFQIINYSDENNIPLFLGNPRNDKATTFIDSYDIDLLLSVNYLFMIERKLFSKSKLAVNIHGSLLPKYRGRTPHVWAIINNESKTGITAHLIDDGCDTGDIIKQEVVQIGVKDTGADVLEKFKPLYLKMVDHLIKDLSNNNIQHTPQNNNIATFFGKRTPKDGQINWNWHKERIMNWVRAQSEPYPGSFTYYKNHKLIVDKISFCDLGYHENNTNGLIVSAKPICVKTPNGVVELIKVRNFESLPKIEIGQILT